MTVRPVSVCVHAVWPRRIHVTLHGVLAGLTMGTTSVLVVAMMRTANGYAEPALPFNSKTNEFDRFPDNYVLRNYNIPFMYWIELYTLQYTVYMWAMIILISEC